MKKFLYLFVVLGFCSALNQNVFAQGVFDSMDNAPEVKLAPAPKPVSAQNLEVPTPTVKAPETAAVVKSAVSESTETPKNYVSIKEQKFNSALTNLDDAQVELRQELGVLNAKYTQALDEKEKIILNCKNLKREIKNIDKKMKNVEKSKKMINKTLEDAQ